MRTKEGLDKHLLLFLLIAYHFFSVIIMWDIFSVHWGIFFRPFGRNFSFLFLLATNFPDIEVCLVSDKELFPFLWASVLWNRYPDCQKCPYHKRHYGDHGTNIKFRNNHHQLCDQLMNVILYMFSINYLATLHWLLKRKKVGAWKLLSKRFCPQFLSGWKPWQTL